MPGKFGKQETLVSAPVASTGVTIPTHEGGTGYVRDAKSELFLLAVTNMVSEGTFYESALYRDGRFERLVHQVTVEDPAWIRGFVSYLRDTMQMRSASIVMAAEYVRAGGPQGRQVVASACSRADEPGEMLAYWFSRYGKRLPKPVKRGVADAAVKLYNERSLIKYDQPPWRFGNVILVSHPRAKAPWQVELFKQAVARHNGEDRPIPEDLLPVLAARARIAGLPEETRPSVSTEALQAAGMTWEAISAWRPGGMTAEVWESVIPSMGYMALLRNLRNFEQAGVSADVLRYVSGRLTEPEAVAKSRQFPIRFLSAWKATQSMTFGPTLETALQLSVANVPALPGRTLILIDCSGSMFHSYYGGVDGISDKSKAQRFELAGIFGFALAVRAEDADVWTFGNDCHKLSNIQKSASVLRLTTSLQNMGGTETWKALRTAYQGHNRVIILTDEQTFPGSQPQLPDGVSLYTFNVAGYRPSHAPSGRNRSYTFGGLTDAGFRMIELLERGKSARWPWEEKVSAPTSLLG